jgi:hypothetical protein
MKISDGVLAEKITFVFFGGKRFQNTIFVTALVFKKIEISRSVMDAERNKQKEETKKELPQELLINQMTYFLSSVLAASALASFLLNLSMRPSDWTNLCLPV